MLNIYMLSTLPKVTYLRFKRSYLSPGSQALESIFQTTALYCFKSIPEVKNVCIWSFSALACFIFLFPASQFAHLWNRRPEWVSEMLSHSCDFFFSILYFNMGLIYLVSNKGNTGEMVMQVRDRNSKQVLLLTDFFFLLKLTLAPNLLKSIKNKQA